MMLSDSFLKRLDALALRMRHPASGGSGGLRRSRALGSSVEFSDFREYAAGDDIRRVDWNAYARFEKLFLKLFMEEQEQRVHLIVDASASMDFGKWEPACQLAQTLGYLCLCGGDSVTVHTLGGGGERHTRPLRGRHCYPELSAFLEGTRPQGRAMIETAVPAMRLAGGRGASVLIGDLLDGWEQAVLSLLYRKQETSVLQVWSAAEWDPQLEDAAELVDSETGERFLTAGGYEALRRYRETARAYVEEVSAFCRARGVCHGLIIPEEPFEDQLIRALSAAGLVA